MSEVPLSPELQTVMDRALINYEEGGISALETMVTDLAAEAELAKIGFGVTSELVDEAFAVYDLTEDSLQDADQVLDAVGTQANIAKETASAISAHSFASWLLEQLRDSTTS